MSFFLTLRYVPKVKSKLIYKIIIINKLSKINKNKNYQKCLF